MFNVSELPLNPIDILVLSIITLCFIFGLMRGMIETVFSIAGYLVAFFGSSRLTSLVVPYAGKLIKNPTGAIAASYVILFIALFVGMKWLKLLAVKSLKFIGLDSLDKIFGGLLGIIKGVLISCIVILFLDAFFPVFSAYVENAESTRILAMLLELLKKSIPYFFNVI